MKPKQQIIDLIRSGKLAIKNTDGSLEELIAVLKEIWPEDRSYIKGSEAYYLDDGTGQEWFHVPETNLPRITIKEYLSLPKTLSLENKKVYVGKFSKEIQDHAFKLGFGWGTNKEKLAQNLEKPFLYFSKETCVITYADSVELFNDNKYGYEELTPEQILSIPIPEPKKHEFKPFDRVLVRDRDTHLWKCDFYSYKIKDAYSCTGNLWFQCIPFEGNEHLVGTSDN